MPLIPFSADTNQNYTSQIIRHSRQLRHTRQLGHTRQLRHPRQLRHSRQLRHTHTPDQSPVQGRRETEILGNPDRGTPLQGRSGRADTSRYNFRPRKAITKELIGKALKGSPRKGYTGRKRKTCARRAASGDTHNQRSEAVVGSDQQFPTDTIEQPLNESDQGRTLEAAVSGNQKQLSDTTKEPLQESVERRKTFDGHGGKALKGYQSKGYTGRERRAFARRVASGDTHNQRSEAVVAVVGDDQQLPTDTSEQPRSESDQGSTSKAAVGGNQKKPPDTTKEPLQESVGRRKKFDGHGGKTLETYPSKGYTGRKRRARARRAASGDTHNQRSEAVVGGEQIPTDTTEQSLNESVQGRTSEDAVGGNQKQQPDTTKEPLQESVERRKTFDSHGGDNEASEAPLVSIKLLCSNNVMLLLHYICHSILHPSIISLPLLGLCGTGKGFGSLQPQCSGPVKET
ncbi:uncharacterized protein LOC141665200 [Apium graveolens]|uniref:uncharacterized protein LOC141665200 n=1 Tax=Apium graveolens TaxID=4045 RepID=UPI003D7A2978